MIFQVTPPDRDWNILDIEFYVEIPKGISVLHFRLSRLNILARRALRFKLTVIIPASIFVKKIHKSESAKRFRRRVSH